MRRVWVMGVVGLDREGDSTNWEFVATGPKKTGEVRVARTSPVVSLKNQSSPAGDYFFFSSSISLRRFSTISSCRFLGTGLYLLNSIVKPPFPWVIDRSSLA